MRVLSALVFAAYCALFAPTCILECVLLALTILYTAPPNIPLRWIVVKWAFWLCPLNDNELGRLFMHCFSCHFVTTVLTLDADDNVERSLLTTVLYYFTVTYERQHGYGFQCAPEDRGCYPTHNYTFKCMPWGPHRCG